VISSFVGDIHKVINTLILIIFVWFDGQSPYSYPSALFMMSFIAKGVKDLHANGILHKDLKASNILVGIRVEMSNWVPEGQAELVDLLDINRVKIGDYEITEGMIGSAFWRSDYDFILSGKRPELPAVVIEDLRSLLESCWHKSNKVVGSIFHSNP
ncbi:hypothetical protein BDL97_04G027000, partial [Sphagnum fallax]